MTDYTASTLPPIEKRAPPLPDGATLLTCPWEVLLLISDTPYAALDERRAAFRWLDGFAKASRTYGSLLLKLVAPKDHPMFNGFKAYIEADPDVLRPTVFGFVHAEANFVASLRPHPGVQDSSNSNSNSNNKREKNR